MTRANRLFHPGGGTGKCMELRSLEFNNCVGPIRGTAPTEKKLGIGEQ